MPAALAAVALLACQCLAAEEADPHAAHRAMMAAQATSNVQRSVVQYELPEITLLDVQGRATPLSAALADGKPVVLNFIYTTCTTICPLSSQVFSLLQQKLGPASERVRMVSISIDPEEDTPPRLLEYATRFHAGSAWQHYTGTLADSVAVQRAFNAYRGDKMNHTPLTLVRGPAGNEWVRLDGFATADQILAEVRNFLPAT
jgi:protein SCO1/2